MDTNVKLSIASDLNKMLNSAKSILEINDFQELYLGLWTRSEILDGIKFYESKLSELDPINHSPGIADWEYFCSVNY